MAKFTKILIVDDSDLDRATLQKLIEKNGYSVVTASDGPEGIQKAMSEKPDCILMDVVMPTLSGFEATRTLHEDPLTKNIPIIICSTKSLKTDEMWGKRQGAVDYVVKPIKEAEVIAAIRRAESR